MDYETNDAHFYLDNAPPEEVAVVLRILSDDMPMSGEEIAKSLTAEYGYEMQRDHTYTPRRLYDLGLAVRRSSSNRVTYALSPLGKRLQPLIISDVAFCADLFHYLHYTGFRSGGARKYLWSYRRCCETIWLLGRFPRPSDLAATIQSAMENEFPDLDWTARVGARFDTTAVRRVRNWLRALTPAPIPDKGDDLRARHVDRIELALLALDDTVRHHEYRYGDFLLMDAEMRHTMAGVFFLDGDCLYRLLQSAARAMPHRVCIADTLAGPTIALLKPYTTEDV